MAVSSQKLLPQRTGGAVTPVKISAITSILPIVKKKSVTDKDSKEESKDTLVVIKERCIEINTLLKGSLALDKIRADQQRKKVEQQKRVGQEDELESKKKDKKEKGPGLSMPKISFLDRMKNFIKNVLLGFILVRLVEFAPILQKIVPVIAGVTEFISNVFLGIIDGLGTFLNWGFTAWENSEKKLKEWGGEDAAKDLNKLGDTLGDLFNAIAIVGMVSVAMSPKGTKNLLRRELGLKPKTPLTPTKPGIKPTTSLIRKPGSALGPRGNARKIQLKHGHAARGIYQNSYDNAISKGKTPKQAAETANAAVKRLIDKGKIISKPQTGSLGGTDKSSSLMKGGLKKTPGRVGLKLFGKQGVKLVSKTFGKIPVMGPLIVAVASLLAGEPLGQAVFKGLGAALGGLLGSFIPIPVIGTILGETIGVLVGDMLYSLTMGGGVKEAGQKFMTALKTVMDVGGLIVNFFKEGFGRLIDNFPMTDVSDAGWGALQIALAKVLPFLDKDGNGKVEKIPDFSILNPLLNPIGFVTKLVPHAAASFFPAIFGKGGTAFGDMKAPNNDTSQDNSTLSDGGNQTQGITSPANVEGMEASKKGKIYLHWTAGAGMTGYPNRYHSTILSDGSKVQKIPYSQFNTPGGHTAYRNSQGVGLAVAAMAGWNWSSIKPAQLDAFAGEAATVAKQMGYSKSMINVRNITTHAEVGSMKDGGKNTPAMSGAKSDPDNYGPAWSGWGGDGTRSDFIDINKADYNAQKGIGGDKLRAMIKAKMRLGGPTMGRGLYEMGEEGKEFVIDADSTRALQGTFPGLLKALNKAEGDKAINVLRSYADYETAEVIPVPVLIKQPMQNVGGYNEGKKLSVNVSTSKKESFSDILYMR